MKQGLVTFAGSRGPKTCAMIFLLASIWLLPSEAFSMNTYRVEEEVTGESYSEVMKAWHARKFSMLVGVTDSGEEYVLFNSDTGLGEATVAMPYAEAEISTIEQLLVTAQEWATIAKKNHADTEKVLGCFPNAQFLICEKEGMPYGENQIGLRFYARNKGQQRSLIIDMADQSNRYKRATIYFGPLEMAALTRNIRQIGHALSKARETARKQHLFMIPPKNASIP